MSRRAAPHCAALFDMDGLLIDSERTIMQAWLAEAGARGASLTRQDYLAVVGRSAPESDALLSACFGGRAPFEQARAAVQRRLETLRAAGGFPLKPGAARLLAALAARGVPCAVASSSSRHEIDVRLTQAGVRHHFGACAGGDEVASGKPDPALYRLAAQRRGVSPAVCLAFEDIHHGARSALAAGARLVLVPDLLPPSADLVAGATVVLASLDEALPQVDAWFGRPRR